MTKPKCSIIYFLLIFQVKRAIQQLGYLRKKRGMEKQIRGIPIKNSPHTNNARTSNLPNDPLYAKEWYIVSIKLQYLIISHRIKLLARLVRKDDTLCVCMCVCVKLRSDLFS